METISIPTLTQKRFGTTPRCFSTTAVLPYIRFEKSGCKPNLGVEAVRRNAQVLLHDGSDVCDDRAVLLATDGSCGEGFEETSSLKSMLVYGPSGWGCVSSREHCALQSSLRGS